MSENKKKKVLSFQAEIKKLLNILSPLFIPIKRSFYELISNASDALTKVRYHALTHPDYEGKELPLEINIDLDEKTRPLLSATRASE